MSATAWYQHAVFYEVSVRTFQDGDGDGLGDFVGLTRRLDYLAELGVDCLWLLPMYPSPLRDDGYDIADFRGIHPDLGTLDDFKRFLEAAKARGLRVIADLVLNHTSSDHPWFQAARLGKTNPYHDYYVWSDTDTRYAGTRLIFTDTETSNWAWDELAEQFYWHRFFSHQPDLNYENPQLQAEMLEVVRFWLGLGLDGFRADAVPYLFEAEGTTSENLPATHAFLKRLRAEMDQRFPGAILLGEANQWPAEVREYFGDGDELHMSFNFPVMPRLFEAVRRHDRGPLSWILGRIPPIPPACQWATFLRNHDELTLEMVTDAERTYMWQEYAPLPRMRLNVGIRRRLWPLLDDDRRRVELLHSMLLSLPGAPVLYYGDEIGMGDNVWLPDRYGVRTPMQWDDNRNAGFSTALPSALYLPVIVDPGHHYLDLNVERARASPCSFWHWLRRLLQVRRALPVMATGAMRLLEPENPAIFAFWREAPGARVLAVHNLSERAQCALLDLSEAAGQVPVEVLGGERFPTIGSASYPLSLAPYGSYWFELEPAGA